MEDASQRQEAALPHHAKSGEPFAMASIYARAETNDAPATFAILTTTANELMAPIHERMRVILPLHHGKNWLPPTPSGMFIFRPFRQS